MRPSRLITLAAALLGAVAAQADAPARVVSLNLCTDQLAMALATPGQLVSVSRLAADPRSSAMAEQARAFASNNGSAEAVVRLRPDLVLAGTWTTRATTDLLEQLGVRVERFAPVNSFDEARANIARMGALLGRPEAAQQMIDSFDAELARLRAIPGPSPRTALYYALGNTAGPATLPGEIMQMAGLANIAADLDIGFYGALPLETLILQDPDLILVGRPYNGHARATELLAHPALARSGKLRQIDTGSSWTCETPALLDAVQELIALRQSWDTAR